jgi:hypothetical protein
MKRILLLGLSGLMLWGCSPKNTEATIDELDLTITNKKEGTDFSQYKTYAITDSVQIITEDPNKDSSARQEVDIIILNEIDAQMDKYGYEKIALKDTAVRTPDIVLDVARLVLDNSGTAYVPGYCGGGGYWGWGWGYPSYGWCYPGYAVDYNYSTGTVIVNYADLKLLDVEEQVITVLWTMTSNGYIQGDGKNVDESRVQTNIARGFEQSPYLQTK